MTSRRHVVLRGERVGALLACSGNRPAVSSAAKEKPSRFREEREPRSPDASTAGEVTRVPRRGAKPASRARPRDARRVERRARARPARYDRRAAGAAAPSRDRRPTRKTSTRGQKPGKGNTAAPRNPEGSTRPTPRAASRHAAWSASWARRVDDRPESDRQRGAPPPASSASLGRDRPDRPAWPPRCVANPPAAGWRGTAASREEAVCGGDPSATNHGALANELPDPQASPDSPRRPAPEIGQRDVHGAHRLFPACPRAVPAIP
jgi:hypothetical protein